MQLLTLKLANNAPTHPLRVNKQLNTVTVNVPILMLFWRPNEVYVCIHWKTDSRNIYCVMFKRQTLGPIKILVLNGERERYIIFSVMVNLEMVTVAFVGVNFESVTIDRTRRLTRLCARKCPAREKYCLAKNTNLSIHCVY